jgi:hypothetical protein
MAPRAEGGVMRAAQPGQPGFYDPEIEEAIHDAQQSARSEYSGSKESGRVVTLTRASDVEIEGVRFAIDGRVPLGAVSLLVGVGGLGKSTLALAWAAQITRGTMSGDLYGKPADVLIASAEDARAQVLVPRLEAAGADCHRVHFPEVTVGGLCEGLALPIDVNGVAEQMARRGARLLLVDPLIAHLPLSINADRDQHVRLALAPLARLAEELDAAVVAIMHLNKREAADIMVRVNGSGGFVNAARSVLVVGADPTDPESRIVAHAKCNVAELAPSRRFRIESRSIRGRDGDVNTSGVVFMGDAEGVTANDLVRTGSDDDGTAVSEAVAFLRETLPIGQEIPAGEIKRLAGHAGIKNRTLERARQREGVAVRRRTFGGPYLWCRDSSSPPDDLARLARHADEQDEQGDLLASMED